jgi:hypothetical protein
MLAIRILVWMSLDKYEPFGVVRRFLDNAPNIDEMCTLIERCHALLSKSFGMRRSECGDLCSFENQAELLPGSETRFTRFISDKVRFANDVVPNIPAEYFATFAPIFCKRRTDHCCR